MIEMLMLIAVFLAVLILGDLIQRLLSKLPKPKRWTK